MKKIEYLYQKYATEMQNLPDQPVMDRDMFEKIISDRLASMKCVDRYEEDKLVGMLYYECWEEEDVMHCHIPEYGYYADSEKTLIRLFQKLTDEVVGDKRCEFSVNLYAHDMESIQTFHMMQFGMMSEKGVNKLTSTNAAIPDSYEIRALTKNEIEMLWTDIWENTSAIVEHLRKSPVFYPGYEFTEEVYKEFFMDEDTELIAAFLEHELVGIIEWNRESDTLSCGEQTSVNVGEAYVSPTLRGTGLAEALLSYAQMRAKQQGAEYMWVEHGTANPNARGFWNKYFHTYQYELVRTIESI